MADSSKKTARGKPFEAGKSGNPGGRKSMPENYKEAFSKMSELAITTLTAILDGSDKDAKASDRIKASEIAFDRHLGKAIQQVNVDANVNQIISINKPDFADEAD